MKKTVWIDLDNSPHVPFFVPIMGELRRRGYNMVLTGRDSFQVKELVELFGLECQLIGRHYGKRRILKVAGTLYRALKLVATIGRAKPDLAVSHGSRAQLVAARLLGIESLVMYDYEFARNLRVTRPRWTVMPEVVATSTGRVGNEGVLTYPGIKEDVYVPRFEPDPAIRGTLGLRDEDVVVTVRPPAEEAHYHNPESEVLLTAVLETLERAPGVRVVLLPRTERQAAALRRRWTEAFGSRKMIIPDRVVDGLSLMWSSDAVISGGGTMNREAAALGVPVYSIFRGRIGAVDHYLAHHERLTLIESVDDVHRKIVVVRRRARVVRPASAGGPVLETIVQHLVRVLEGQAGSTGKCCQEHDPIA